MRINNCGQSTAYGLDVMDRQAGVAGGAGNGSVDVSALPQWVCSAGAGSRRRERSRNTRDFTRIYNQSYSSVVVANMNFSLLRLAAC
jgi:hypothetical protein